MKGKRLLSIVLCILMCVSMLPVQAFAEEETEISVPEEVQEPKDTEESEDAENPEDTGEEEIIPDAAQDLTEDKEENSGEEDGQIIPDQPQGKDKSLIVLALRISSAVNSTSYSSLTIAITDNAAKLDHSSNSLKAVSALSVLASTSSN